MTYEQWCRKVLEEMTSNSYDFYLSNQEPGAVSATLKAEIAEIKPAQVSPPLTDKWGVGCAACGGTGEEYVGNGWTGNRCPKC